ncbi:MAG: PhoX family protein [Gammaproteobacteria bacterium]|nr:PhoX family protein [Gammaproteobacteria bacterium]MBU1414224.1 PhoX family protein [Gammaproteobacteria bacterium]
MNKSVIALFPLTAIAAAVAVAVTACGGGSSSSSTPTTTAKTISFAEIAYPTTDAEKRVINASSTVTVDGTAHTIGYNTILRSGDQRGDGIFGLMYDVDGNPLVMTDNSQYISDSNDHSTLLDVHSKVFMVSQFESSNAGFYITELSQDTTSGELSAVSTKPIDLAGINGGWTHCAGMRTPWKSHLGSEEYEPNAAVAGSANRMRAYYGEDSGYTNYVAPTTSRINAYNYGFPVEATVTGADMGTGTFASNVTVAKHYSMGRLAFELSYVMPDSKTVYQSDDGANVGFFRYDADTAGDLSAGTLYAAKFTQTSADNGGSFTIEWISLGHATDSEIRTLIDSGGSGGVPITFSDIFDNNGGDTTTCPGTHTLVSTTTGKECLMVNTGMEKAAAFLETRRYAAMLGATTELNKEEGITFDAEHNRLFVAMSDVSKGMEDGHSSDLSTYNHIRVAKNNCGTVYALDVDAGYIATNMYPVVSGTPTTYDAASPYYGNTCDVNGIANPDNVTFIPGYNTLIIGEDTGSGHQTDLIWSYDMATSALTRIQSTPYGSETTSPYFYPNINGFGYMMSVIQHPYGESDTNMVTEGSAERRAYTGYVGPFPAMD